jgi:hypothetical protein
VFRLPFLLLTLLTQSFIAMAQQRYENTFKIDPIPIFLKKEPRITAFLEHNYNGRQSYQIGLSYMMPFSLNNKIDRNKGLVARNGKLSAPGFSISGAWRKYLLTSKKYNGIYIGGELQFQRTAFYNVATMLNSSSNLYIDTVKLVRVISRPTLLFGYQWRKRNVIIDLAANVGTSILYQKVKEQAYLEDKVASLDNNLFTFNLGKEFNNNETIPILRFSARLGWVLEWD